MLTVICSLMSYFILPVCDNTTAFYVSILSFYVSFFFFSSDFISFPHIYICNNTKTNHCCLNTRLNPPTSLTTQSESIPPPQEVTCISPSSTSLLLSWAPPLTDENAGITGYSIRYVAVEREKDPVQRISDIPSNCFRYRIEGLKKGTLYSVSVAAHTDTGQGPESLPILIRTEEDGMSIWQCLNLTHDLKLSLPFLHLPKAHLSSQHLPYPETSACIIPDFPQAPLSWRIFPSVSTIAFLSPWWKHGQIPIQGKSQRIATPLFLTFSVILLWAGSNVQLWLHVLY